MTMSRNLLLVVAAVVFAVFAVLGGFRWWDWAERYEDGWIAAVLACFAVLKLP